MYANEGFECAHKLHRQLFGRSSRGGGKHRKSPILQIFEMFYGERMLDTELRAELAGLKGKKQQQWRAHMKGKRRYKLAAVVPAEAPQ